MLTVTLAPKNSSRSSSAKLLEPEVRLDDAACIAQAIAELMDPEWREFVDQEQRKRSMASLGLSEA